MKFIFGKKMAQWHNSIWYQKNIFSCLLLPFSAVYRMAIAIRRLFYQTNIFKTTNFSVPVIVVGNITVGGTGKTPFVIALTELLKHHHYKPGIVSRGYHGSEKNFPHWVNDKSDPKHVGDEAVLLARRTQCPVVIDPHRTRAVQMLLSKTDCNVVISDDGLQHYAMGRNIEIAVVDGERRFGNGFCLPAGPLRETITRLNSVDFIVANGAAAKNEFAMTLQGDHIYNIKNSEKQLTLDDIRQPVHAVAAIGNPQRFFKQLKEMGLNIIEHEFPDHYFFKPGDIDFGKNAIVIMTEKDAVKCLDFASDNHWCFAVSAKIEDVFYKQVLDQLSAVSSEVVR